MRRATGDRTAFLPLGGMTQRPSERPGPGHAPSGVGERPILVTGAAGFIGSHVCEALLARGERVVGLDNFDPYYHPRLKERNLREVRAAAVKAQKTHARASFEFVEADIVDDAAMRRLFSRTRPSGVIHLAAKAGVRPSIADPVGYSRANVLGTSVLLEEARRCRDDDPSGASCRVFVMASSSSVYGNNPKVPFSEADDVSGPISPYAATKRACELIGHAHWALTKMPTACLRFFTVYGPRQRPDLAISLFLSRVGGIDELAGASDPAPASSGGPGTHPAASRPIPVFGDGSASRDYTFIDDIVRGVIASYDRVERHGFRIWNLGGNQPVSLSEMIATIERVTGAKAIIDRRPAQPGDVERTFADLTRSGEELGYRPSTSFEEGVRRQWAWLQQTAGVSPQGVP